MAVRINQKDMTSAQWTAFIDAVNQLHGTGAAKPAYRDFVKVHVEAMSMSGMSWAVHSMPSMHVVGRNFLSWHRWFVLQFERRLQKIDPNIAVPYWNAAIDRSLPAALSDPALLASWSVSRSWDASQLPSKSQLDDVDKVATFPSFQTLLEVPLHGMVHMAVGGDMAGSSSPSDPVFWLHHANIDRIWARWQKQHAGQNPPNPTETLKPKPIFGKKVQDELDVSALGYGYA